MPFKSKAQRRKFAALLLSGEITPEQYERWNRETGSAELPERAKPHRKRSSARKPKRAKKARKKAKTRPKTGKTRR